MSDPSNRVLTEGSMPDGAAASVLDGKSLDAAYRDRLLELLKLAFEGRWPALELPVSPAEHLDWKLDGPFASEPTYVMVADRQGRLVSLSVAIQERVLVNGSERPFYLSSESCTHPDYFGRGIHNQMKRFEDGNVRLWADGAFSVTRNPTLEGWIGRRGWGIPQPSYPQVLLRVHGPGRFAEVRRNDGSRVPAPLLRAAFAALRLAGRGMSLGRRPKAPSWDVVEVQQFDDRFDDLFADAATQFRFIKVRTAEYLRWRYGDRRGGEYLTLMAEEAGRVLGYIALKFQNDRGFVLDILARPGRDDVVSSLLARAAQTFRDAQVITSECWMPPSHPYRGLLRRNGYFNTRRPSGVYVYTYPGEREDSLDFFADKDPKVHLMLGDVDNI